MKPQHDISKLKHMDNTDGDRFTFLGSVYEIDVYRNNWLSCKWAASLVPTAVYRAPSARISCGQVSSTIQSGTTSSFRDDDVHVGVHHLVEIYRLMKESPHETPTDI
jgi:hypothetical protein